MRQPNFSTTLRRSIQLDALAYLLIAGLLVITAILAFMLFNSVAPPTGWVLDDTAVQLVGLAFVGAIVFYLLEQHGRLRRDLEASHEQLERARIETEQACKGLTTAHHVAEVVTSVTGMDALERAVESIRRDFGADAVCVVGDETTSSFAPDVAEFEALEAITRVAADTVRTASPIAISNDEDGSTTLAVPLRVNGHLQGVLCLWQQAGRLSAEELEGLTLIARVLELGWESQIAYGRVNEQLGGIVSIVAELVDQRIPGYAEETARMLDLALSVASDLEMTDDEIADLEVAVRLRDLGVLSEQCEQPLFGRTAGRGATAKHPLDGARLAELGHFSSRVSKAILCHHECPDGSGFPVHLTGDNIPRSAAVIHACEAFLELSEGEEFSMQATKALSVMRQGSATSFDPQVVDILESLVKDRADELVMAESSLI